MMLSSTSRQMIVAVSAKRTAILSLGTNYRVCSALSKQLPFRSQPLRCFSTPKYSSNNVMSDHDSFVQTYGFREGLPRFPEITTPTGILRGLDYFGTIVFAARWTQTSFFCFLPRERRLSFHTTTFTLIYHMRAHICCLHQWWIDCCNLWLWFVGYFGSGDHYRCRRWYHPWHHCSQQATFLVWRWTPFMIPVPA